MIRSDILRARRAVNRAIKYCLSIVDIKPLNEMNYRLSDILRRTPGKAKDRVKEEGVQELKRTLDDIFSKYIRLKNADGKGRVDCFTCDTIKRWQEMENGHFIKRRFTKLRYEPRNNHPQCHNCNVSLKGNLIIYEQRLKEKYGQETVDFLNANAKQKRWTRFELKHRIKHYTEELQKIGK